MKKHFNIKSFIIFLLFILLVVNLFPIFVVLSTSLKGRGEIYSSPPTWLPDKFTLENYKEIFEVYPLARFFLNSLILAFGGTILNIAITIPAAYATARLRFKGRKLVMYMLLMVQMFSPVIIIAAIFRELSIFGLLDSYLGLIIINAVFTIAFSIWMLTAYFMTIPIDLEEAAMIDGCNRFQAVTKVVLPLLGPGLAATMAYTFIWIWNEFLFALTFINRDELRPLTVGIYNFIGRAGIDWHLITAASITAIMPVVVLFMVIEKQLIQGLTGGAVKG